MTKPIGPNDLLAQLQAARREVGRAAALSKRAHELAQAKSLAQQARLAREAGDSGKARALTGDAGDAQRHLVDGQGADIKV